MLWITCVTQYEIHQLNQNSSKKLIESSLDIKLPVLGNIGKRGSNKMTP